MDGGGRFAPLIRDVIMLRWFARLHNLTLVNRSQFATPAVYQKQHISPNLIPQNPFENQKTVLGPYPGNYGFCSQFL